MRCVKTRCLNSVPWVDGGDRMLSRHKNQVCLSIPWNPKEFWGRGATGIQPPTLVFCSSALSH